MEARPVTLLLTDVEASTGLLVRQGTAGVVALGRVAEMVFLVADQHGGRVSLSQGEGDSAVVLFPTVAQALAAALEMNERMAEEPWPAGERVVVRSAVHVGHVTTTPEGVFGLEVHRCARLRGLADGGEVVLSNAAVTCLGPHLPIDASVADEGLVLLRGFAQPERVWRLVHPVLRPRLRPILGTGQFPGALPTWQTSFVGRAAEMASVAARLDTGRVVTLVGPAGVGKTRLAASVTAESPLRACFVDLTGATNDGEVPSIAAEALGVDSGLPPLTGIEGVLRAAPALVVVDNCEHVLEAAASLVDHLLARCPGTSVLATSRAALRVSGEDVVSVAPLSTEAGGAATELFVDRARAARNGVCTDDDVLEKIAALADLLDGVPLAIELAAARVAAFSVGEILELLRRDMAGLGDARRRGPYRHRTLSAAITWSLRMVSDDERRLLCRLAVLPGSFRLVTAVAISDSGDDEGRAVVAAMSLLVEQSLIVAEHRPGPTRYRLLEMIRAVAQTGLTVADRKALRDRLLNHCLAELARLDVQDLPATGIEAEIARDHALYVNAVEHALATDQTELGLRLVYDLFPVWHGATQRWTLDRWMTALVAQAKTPSRARGAVLRRQAIIASEDQGDYQRAFNLLDLAEADAVALADRQLLGRVRATRAGVDYDRGHLDALEADLWDAITLLEETGDNYAADALTMLANVYVQRAQFVQADEILTRAAAAKPHWSRRMMIEQIHAWNALMRGQIESAASRAASALDMAERSENTDLVVGAVEVAAYAALAQGQAAVARQLFVRMVAFAREHELPHLSDALAGLATVSALGGDLTVARSCRDELRGRPEGRAETLLHNRLRCALVDLADGNVGQATVAATDLVADADLVGEPYAHLLALELLAASVATDDPRRARELLAAADEERTAVGATAWPFEPYRQLAARTLDVSRPNPFSAPC